MVGEVGVVGDSSLPPSYNHTSYSHSVLRRWVTEKWVPGIAPQVPLWME